MTDYPIIMSGAMVRALFQGRKTMTRQRAYRDPISPIDEQHADDLRSMGWKVSEADDCGGCVGWPPSPWRLVGAGDRLWVREAWKPHSGFATWKPRDIPKSKIFYRADDAYAPSNTSWRAAIHMPRWASRLTLVVTATTLERLYDITDGDAVREGVYCTRASENDDRAPTVLFFALWDALHGACAAAANPQVVALSFHVHLCNIDRMDSEHQIVARSSIGT